MRRFPTLLALVALIAVALFGVITAGARAQEGGPPPPDATPGAVGVSGPVLGELDPTVAAGYRLQMSETRFAPGAYVTRHTHPSAFVVCVIRGALGFAIQAGAATVTRAGSGDAPESTEPMALNVDVVLEPSDCVAVDEYAAHTSHTAWNASDEETVIWAADLYKKGEPFTTFVDAQGTPVP
jgi:hypothetical protein